MKKTQNLQRKIIANIAGSVALASLLIVIIFYLIEVKSSSEENIKKIKLDTSSIRNQKTELEGKLNDAKKYKEVWKIIDDSKKNATGPKMDDVNNNFATLALKHNIANQTIQVSLPELMSGGIFDRKTIKISRSTASISFEAVSDLKANNFITEFFNKLPGYPVITELSIKKTKKYSADDLVLISSGKNAAAISVKADFTWYTYVEKSGDVNDQ